LGDPVPYQNLVWHAAVAQMLALGLAGRAAANDERIYFLNRHSADRSASGSECGAGSAEIGIK
jgi:hypothetical protein